MDSNAGIKQGRTRYGGLDGLRAVAIMSVFSVHYLDPVLDPKWGSYPFWWGWVGVDLFFVLSGFLITGILFDTLGSERYFRNFYIRRTLRIFPLFYAVWLLFLLITPFVHVGWNRYIVAQMLYVGNLTYIVPHHGVHADPGQLQVGRYIANFTHFWTLCIEEQFYLLWPLVVYFVRGRLALLRTAIGGSVLILLLRCVIILWVPCVGGTTFLDAMSFARFDSLLIGGALALWLRGKPAGFIASRCLYLPLIGIPACLLTLLQYIFGDRWPARTYNPIVCSVGFTLLALSAVGAILAALDERSVLYKVLTLRWLVSLGAVSYGFYVFHSIPQYFFFQNVVHFLPGWHARRSFVFLMIAVLFVLTYLLSMASFQYFEKPFLRLKERWASAKS